MPEVTWLDVVKSQLAANPGKSVKDVVPAARKEWNLIKSGKHPTKTQGKMVIKKKGSKKKQIHPKKGQPSRTRPGHLDFVTHKGDKYYHRKGKIVKKKHAPYTQRKKHKGGGMRSGFTGGNETSNDSNNDPSIVDKTLNAGKNLATNFSNTMTKAVGVGDGSAPEAVPPTPAPASQMGGGKKRHHKTKSHKKHKKSHKKKTRKSKSHKKSKKSKKH